MLKLVVQLVTNRFCRVNKMRWVGHVTRTLLKWYIVFLSGGMSVRLGRIILNRI